MESLKAVFWKPDPKTQASLLSACPIPHHQTQLKPPPFQMRNCNTIIRANIRTLDRDMRDLKALEQKTRSLILAASKRAQRNPSQATQAASEMRTFARELLRIRKQSNRVATSKAQLHSVQLQVNEAFSVRKIEGSLKSSTGIMKDVNTLVRLPQLTDTMRQLSQELMKAGIIEEMVGDSLPDAELLEGEDEEAEGEVEKVLGEVLKGQEVPRERVEVRPEEESGVEVGPEEQEEQEATLAQMRGRLEALRS